MSLSLVDTSPVGFRPLSARDLNDLQAEQFEHDERWHREIARLPVQDRLRHMTLHFSKYVGRLLDNDDDDLRTIIDVFVIALSSANVLSLHLAPDSVDGGLARSEFVRLLGVATGKMSAACEKLDHLEDVPFRQILSQNVIAIFSYVQGYARTTNLNLACSARLRLEGVRNKAFIAGQSI